MKETDLANLSARDVATIVRQKKVSAVEVTRATLERIARLNEKLKVFITITAEQALREAEQVDKDVRAGKDKPLAGVPLAVKDLYETKGVRTTAGSRLLADNVPNHDATAVARLRQVGAVLVGKLSMHEFAFGFTNVNPHYGNCLNPWDVERIPGGSSGGSGAALAASLCLASLGSDTGGSIRLPAALCGVVGLKPTYGRVSRFGALPLSWTMDHVGPMTKRVEDAALMLRVIAGQDAKDETSSKEPAPDYVVELKKRIKGVRLGVPHAHFIEPMDAEVNAAFNEAVHLLEKLGARLVEVTLPHLDVVLGAHRAIIFSEASTYHEKWLRTRADEYGDDIRALLQTGMFFTATQYLSAQQARRRIIAEWSEIWKKVDALVTPTSPIPAAKIGDATTPLGGEERPLVRVYLDSLLPFNLTGQPALSVPCGFTNNGLPIGLQLVGRSFDESLLLRIGHAYETQTAWHKRQPKVTE